MANAAHVTGTESRLLPRVFESFRHRGISKEFELWAPDFHNTITKMMGRYFAVKYDDLVEMLANRIATSQPERVLEVGCGPGLIMGAVASRLSERAKVCGLDVVPAMLDRGRETAKEFQLEDKMEFLRAPAERIPYPDATFDVAYSSLCFHHFRARVAFSEQLRVLRPGGRLIVFDLGALDVWRTLKGRIFYNCVTRLRYFTLPQMRDEAFAIHRTRDEWRRFLADFPVDALEIEDHSRRTGRVSEEKLLFGKYVTYKSMGTAPLFYIECKKR